MLIMMKAAVRLNRRKSDYCIFVKTGSLVLFSCSEYQVTKFRMRIPSFEALVFAGGVQCPITVSLRCGAFLGPGYIGFIQM